MIALTILLLLFVFVLGLRFTLIDTNDPNSILTVLGGSTTPQLNQARQAAAVAKLTQPRQKEVRDMLLALPNWLRNFSPPKTPIPSSTPGLLPGPTLEQCRSLASFVLDRLPAVLPVVWFTAVGRKGVFLFAIVQVTDLGASKSNPPSCYWAFERRLSASGSIEINVLFLGESLPPQITIVPGTRRGTVASV